MGGGNKNPIKQVENLIDKNTDSLSSAGRKINKGIKKVGKEIGRATEDVFDFVKAPFDNISGAIGGGGDNTIPETETVDPNLLTEEMAKRRKLALAMQKGYMSTIRAGKTANNIDLLQPNLTGKKTLGQ
jgi:hypothetical protein